MPERIQPEVNPNTTQVEPFEWTENYRQFVTDTWGEFWKMYQLKNEGMDMLNGRTLQQFWDDSNRDYGVVLAEPEEENDPVKQYQSTISRDKADVFIANLTGQLMYSDVIAQNPEQEVDAMLGRISSSLLYWAYRNDGWPSESGEQKTARYIHKMVVEGTVHVLDLVDKNGLTSELVPNEEIYIGNYWQPDIQKQPKVHRAKLNILYQEAEQEFGHLDNWKYVTPNGWSDFWYRVMPFFKDGFQGIIKQDRVSVLYVWSQATPSQLKKLKEQGKVLKGATRACFYNILINDIPMFESDNLLPYKDGFYPISKGIFCKFAKSECYWGNSAPNKVREDKRWIDNWKTLIRYKAKLGLLKPMLVIGGHLDEQIVLPSKVSNVEAGMEIQAVPGVADGISQQDVALLQMAESEIDRGSVSPQVSGQQGDSMTARSAVIQATNAEKMLDSFSREVAYFQASRSFPLLMRLYQFLPKRSIKKIAIPDQTLFDGIKGTFEVIFREMPDDLDEMKALQMEMDTQVQMDNSRKSGTAKDIVYLPMSYVRELKFFLYSDANSSLRDKDSMRQQALAGDIQLLLSLPEVNRTELLHEYFRMRGYNDRILNRNTQPQAQDMDGAVPAPARQAPEPTGEEGIQAASQDLTGQRLPSLPNLGV